MSDIYNPSSPLKNGQAVISGGAQQYGIPTRGAATAQSTSTLNVNEARYLPLYVEYPVTLKSQVFEVTTAPGANANVRIGLYLADGTLQPTGAPVYDSGNLAIASGFTGVKTTAISSILINPGVYLMVINTDTSLAVRTFLTPVTTFSSNLGANPFIQRFFVAQTFGAFPNPGTLWTGAQSGGSGYQQCVAWQWSE